MLYGALTPHAGHGGAAGSNLANGSSTFAHLPVFAHFLQDRPAPDADVSVKVCPALLGCVHYLHGVEFKLELPADLGGFFPEAEVLC